MGVRKEGLGDGGREKYTSPTYKQSATQACREKLLAASEAWTWGNTRRWLQWMGEGIFTGFLGKRFPFQLRMSLCLSQAVSSRGCSCGVSGRWEVTEYGSAEPLWGFGVGDEAWTGGLGLLAEVHRHRIKGTMGCPGGLQIAPAGRQGSLQRGKETWGRALLLLEELWWGAHHVSCGTFPNQGANPCACMWNTESSPPGSPLKNF